MRNQSDYVYNRIYQGRVKGLVLDWSGTTADEYAVSYTHLTLPTSDLV